MAGRSTAQTAAGTSRRWPTASGDEGSRGRTILVFSLAAAVPACGTPDGLDGPIATATQRATTFLEQQKLVASDAKLGARFGASVSIDGDTALVGATGGSDPGGSPGAAYVWTRSGATWSEQQKLTADDGAPVDIFGFSAAVSGDTAVIGAPRHDIGGDIDRGAAYVFVRSGATWSQQQKLTANDGAGGDWFGYSVAVDGDTVLVGARTADVSGNADQGAAYVFVRSGTTWTQEQKLIAADGAADDLFGHSVGLDGDTAIVGARDEGPLFEQGAAYVFSRAGATWSEQQKLRASDGDRFDYFGISVDVDADTAIVGACCTDDGSDDEVGAGYAFTRVGTTWSEQQKLTTAGAMDGDRLGYSVALEGDRAVLGAIGAGPGLQGAAYVFERAGTAWSERDRLTAGDGVDGDQLGAAVALSGDTVVAGAEWHSAQLPNDGAAYVFAFGCESWPPPSPDTGFCTEACPCADGQGDCDSDAECQQGLICVHDVGDLYGMPAVYDVCVDPGTPVPQLAAAGARYRVLHRSLPLRRRTGRL